MKVVNGKLYVYMYMKLEFSTKLNNIREMRRLRTQRETLERESKQKQINKEDLPTNVTAREVNAEDAKILLQKLHFVNNSSSHKQIKDNTHTSQSVMNKHNHIKNENNAENISIIVSEIIPHAKIKFYE